MCVPMTLLDGGKLIDSQIINGALTGGVTLDAATANDIADALIPLLQGKVGGIDDVELRQAIADLFLGNDGSPLSNALRDNLNTILVAMFEERLKNREGNPLSPGTRLMSAQEIAEAIATALAEFKVPSGDADRVTGATFSNTTGILTIAVAMMDGTPRTWTVDLSQTLDSGTEVTAGAPLAATSATGVPLTVYGSNIAFVGAPIAWGALTVNGVAYRIPLYQG